MPMSSTNIPYKRHMEHTEHVNWGKEVEYQIHSKSIISLPKTLVRSQISFVNISRILATSLPPKFQNQIHCSTIYLIHNPNYQRSTFMSPTDPEEISRIIASLKYTNSSGHDGISSKLLKSLQLTSPLSANQHLDKQINGNRTSPSKHEDRKNYINL